MSRISVLPNDRTSRPSKSICPEVGSVRRNKQRPTVDFPQPDSPTSPSVSPAKISKETPSTARTTSSLPSTGKCLTSPRTFTSCSVISHRGRGKGEGGKGKGKLRPLVVFLPI